MVPAIRSLPVPRRRRAGRALPAFVAVLLLLAACEDPGPKFTLVYMSAQGSERVLAEAARFQGGIPVHADGAPRGADPQGMSVRAARLIAGVINRPDWVLRPAGPPPRTAEATRMVLSFDPQQGFSGVSLCQGRSIAAEEPPGALEGDGAAPPMTFRLVLCDGERRTAEILATLPRPDGPDDAVLAGLIRQSAAALVARETQRKD